MKKERLIELTVESIGFEGISIARKDGIVYFVKNGIPGDKVTVRVKKKKRNYYETEIQEIINPSNERVEPKCNYFYYCGGCTWQHLNYESQLHWKKQHVKDAFERLAKIDIDNIYDTLPSPKQFNYRNKMEFSFGSSRWLMPNEIENMEVIEQKNFALGLHISGRYDKIIDIDECKIQTEIGNLILQIIRDKALTFGAIPWNTRDYNGFLRNLIIRKSDAYNEIMVVLVTSDKGDIGDDEFIEWYYNDFPDLMPNINVIAHAVNNSLSPVAVGDLSIIKGEGFITERIMNLDFRISPFSFFQTNSGQLNRFIEKILEFAALESEQIIWDLYCGTGSISLPAATRCKGVIGIELVQSSIDDAQKNAILNGIENVQFFCQDLHSKEISELLFSLPKPDTIIVDPPRAGIHFNLINHLLKIRAKRLVYVSCNPATQARDVRLLSDAYELVKIQPVDMFPQTYHIESVALLKLR